MKKNNKIVEFVSYDGAFPSLCYGQLILKINGQEQKFPEGCLRSGGCVRFDDDWREHVETGKWSIDFPEELEEKLEPFRKEIEECINENIRPGCCGGCV